MTNARKIILLLALLLAITPAANASFLPFNTSVHMNVGIGSASPGQMLDVQGTVRSTGLAVSGQGAAPGYVLTATDSTGDVTWSTAGGLSGWTTAAGLVYSTTGSNNIGIGTSTPQGGLVVTNGNVGIGTWAPGGALTVMGGNVGIGVTSPVGVLHIGTSGTRAILLNNSTLGLTSGHGTYLSNSTDGSFSIIDQESSNFTLGSGNNGIITLVGSDAYVGIGQAVPGSNLSVLGAVSIGDATYSTTTAPSNGLIVKGNVGIGTLAPVNKLDVNGTVAIGAGYAGISTAPSNGLIVQGNVGIGTTGPLVNRAIVLSIATPQTAANEIASIQSQGKTSTDGSAIGEWRMYNGSSALGVLDVLRHGSSGAAFELGLASSAGSMTDRITVDNGGNVGIGGTITDAPNVGFTGASMVVKSGNVGIGTTTPQGSLVVTNGNVGIGTWAPSQALDVIGTARMTGFILTTNPVSNAVIVSNGVGIGTWMPISAVAPSTPPAGTGTELQYRNGTSFGAVTNSAFDGTNVGLGTTTPQGGFVVTNGNVGIGTWSPGNYNLTVNGNVSFAGGNLITSGSDIDVWGRVVAGSAAGSAGAPIFTFGGNTNNGVYSPGTGIWAITTASTERFRVDASGNIGIGTTSTQGGFVVTNGNVGIGTWAPAGALVVQTGNVGFGVANPNTNFVVSGGLSNSIGMLKIQPSSGDDVATLSFWSRASGSSGSARNWMIGSNYVAYGDLAINQSSSSTGNPTAATRMYLDTNGNVGIGTTTPQGGLIVTNGNVGIGTWSPAQELEVQANAASDKTVALFSNPAGTGSTSSSQIAIQGGSYTNTFLRQNGNAGSQTLGGAVDTVLLNTYADGATIGNMHFGTNSLIRMTIRAGGNVGIGSTAAGQKLDVQGTIRSTGLAVSGQGAAPGYVLTATDSTGDVTWSTAGGLSGWTTGTGLVYSTTGSNNIGIGTTTPQGGLVITNGNVGIGTWAPATALSVVGAMTVSSLPTSTENVYDPILIRRSDGVIIQDTSLVLNPGADTLQIGGQAGNPLNLSTGNIFAQSSNLTISTSSFNPNITLNNTTGAVTFANNVGVGTTTPQGGFVVTNGNVGIGTWAPSGALIVETGNVGLGSEIPTSYLTIGADNIGLQNQVRIAPYHNHGGLYLGSGPNTSEMGIHFNTYGRTSNADYHTLDDTTVGAWSMVMGSQAYSASAGFDIRHALATAGTPVFKSYFNISDSGNIGIGTTTAQGAGLVVTNGNVGIGTWAPGGALSVMNGNIGVGINSPSEMLTLYNTKSGAFSSTGAPTATESIYNVDNVGTNAEYASLKFQVSATNLGANALGFLTLVQPSDNNASDFAFTLRNSGGSYAEAMRITSTGNVGIGTTTPQGGLVVTNGNVGIGTWVPPTALAVAAGSSQDVMDLEGTGSGGPGTGPKLHFTLDSSPMIGSGVSDGYIQGYTVTGLNNRMGFNFVTNNGSGYVTAATMDSNGNLGVGSTAPGQTLDVAGTARMTGFALPVSPVNGYVLTSDNNGNGTWMANAASGGWTWSGLRIYATNGNVNVGIGTTTPQGGLTVTNGNVGIGTWAPGNKVSVNGNTQLLAGSSLLFENSASDNHVRVYNPNGSAGASLQFDTNVVGTMYLSTAGNVGISSTSPGNPLDVVGNVGILGNNQLKFYRGDGTNWVYLKNSSASGNQNLGFYITNNTPDMTIINGGNVGIGTTTPQGPLHISNGGGGRIVYDDTTSNHYKWQVGNNISLNNAFEITPSTAIGGLTFSSPAIVIRGGDSNVGIGNGGTIPLNKLDVAGSVGIGAYAGANTGPSNGLIVSGNVGIGTTVPGSKLDVQMAGAAAQMFNYQLSSAGTNYLYGLLQNTGGQLALGVVNSANGNTLINNGLAYASAVGSWNSTPLQLFTNSTARMTFDTAGNVGIGSTIPSYQLDINGTGNATNLRVTTTGNNSSLTLNNSGTGGLPWNINSTNNNAGAGGGKLTIDNSTSTMLTILGSGGNVGIATINPGKALDVNGDIRASNGGAFYGDGSHLTGISGTVSGLTTNYHVKAASATTLTNSIVYDDGTNVGISTSTPVMKLEILGAAYGLPANSGTAQTGGVARFRDSRASGDVVLDIGDSAGTNATWLQSTDMRALNTNYALLLNPNGGNVGIGTTTPDSQLTIFGGAGISIEGTTNNNTGGLTVSNTLTASTALTNSFGIYAYPSINTTGGSATNFATIAANGVSGSKSGGGSVTNAASLLILGQPNFGTNNYGLLVQNGAQNSVLASIDGSSGGAYFKGNVGVGTTTPQAAFVVTNGNVGIGTWVTQYPVDIRASEGDFALRSTTGTNRVGIQETNTGGTLVLGVESSAGGVLVTGTSPYASIIGTQASAYPLQVATNNAVRMTIDSAGNVGIGTVGPVNKLEVAGGITLSGGLVSTVGSGQIFGNSSTATNGGYFHIGTSATDAYWGAASSAGANPFSGTAIANSAIYFGDKDNVPVQFLTTGAVRQTIDGSGNVGIGTTLPSSLLSLTQTGASFEDFTRSGVSIGSLTGSNNDFNINALTNNIAFTVPSGKVYSFSTGNVGIGTFVPGKLLDVSGTGNVYGRFMSTNTTGAGINVKDTGESWYIQADGAAGSHGLAFYDLARSAYRMMIDSAGNVGINSLTPGQNLDIQGSERVSGSYYGDGSHLTGISGSISGLTTGYVPKATGATTIGNGSIFDTGGNIGIGTTTPQAGFIVMNGNVGIGTWAPGYDIEMDKSDSTGMIILLHNLNNTSSAYSALQLETGGGGAGYAATVYTSPGQQSWSSGLDNQDGEKFKITSNADPTSAGNNRLTIQTNGNIGIGTTTPQGGLIVTNGNVGIGTWAPGAKLEVDGASNPEIDWGPVHTPSGSGAYTSYNTTGNYFSINAVSQGVAYRNIFLASDGGSVGIGTINPIAKFNVRGGTNEEFAVGGGSELGSPTTDVFILNDANTTFEPVEFSASQYNFATGSVGIGSTSPGGTLDVGSGSICLGHVCNSSWPAGSVSGLTSGYVPKATGATTIGNGSMFDTGGNVGIGTTTPQAAFVVTNGLVGIGTWVSTGSQLDVVGTIGAIDLLSTTGTNRARYRLDNTGGSAFFGIEGSTPASFINGDSPYSTIIGAAGTYPLQFGHSSAEVTILNGGNVGIGSVGPTSKLDVNGDIKLDGNNGLIGGNNWYEITGVSSSLLQVGSSGGWTSGIEFLPATVGAAMQILQSGNVGIGTTAPVNKLDVNGSMAIGATYAGLTAAPTNGLLVQGNIGVGTSVATAGDLRVSNAFTLNAHTYAENANESIIAVSANNIAFGDSGFGDVIMQTNNRLYLNAGLIIDIGGATNAYPGLVRSGTTLQVRLGDNSGDAPISALTGSFSGSGNSYFTGNVGVGTSTPQGGLTVTNGNVGIGTWAPRLKFEVQGTSNSPATSGTVPNGTASFVTPNGNSLYIGSYTASPYGVWLQNSNWIDLSAVYPLVFNPNGGNVGIGSVTPGKVLDITGDARVSGSYYGDGSHLTGLSGSISGLTTGYVPKATSATTIGNGAIFDNGNIGIGTITPQQNLHVVSEFRLDRPGENYVDEYFTGGIVTGDAIDLVYVPGTKESTGFQFQAYNSGVPAAAMSINRVGNVGIGTWTPGKILDVNGQSLFRDTINIGPTANEGLWTWGSLPVNTSTIFRAGSGNDLWLASNNSVSSTGILIDTNGNVGIGTFIPQAAFTVTNGNVGIGTWTAPSHTLEVRGDLSAGNFAGQANIILEGLTSTSAAVRTSNGADLVFQPNGNTAMYMTTGGNVGVGTTTPQGGGFVVTNGNVGIGTWAPSNPLDVVSGGDASSDTILAITDTGANPGAALTLNTTKATSTYRNWGIATDQHNIGDIAFQQSNAQGGNPITAGTTRMYLDTNGNVGIGTYTPQGGFIIDNGNVGIGTWAPGGLLDIAGQAAYNTGLIVRSVSGANNGASVTLINTDTGGASYSLNSTGSGNGPGAGAFSIYDTTGGAHRLTIKSGNVGISSTAPGQRLDVQGTTRTTDFTMTDSPGNGYVLTSDNNGNATWQPNLAGGGWNWSGFNIYNTPGTNVGVGTSSPQGAFVVTSGNVGIGTWAPGSSALAVVPQVANGIGLLVNDIVIGGYGIYTSNANALNFNYGHNGDDTGYLNYTGYNNGTTHFRSFEIDNGKNLPIANFDGPSGNVGIGTRTPQGGFVVTNGNVGIGTWTPAVALAVRSNTARTVLSFQGSDASAVPGYLYSDTSTLGFKDTAGSSITNGVFVDTGNFARIWTNGSERVRVDSNGNVGIGTATPQGGLAVTNGNVGIGIAAPLATLDVRGSSASTYVAANLQNANTGSNQSVRLVFSPRSNFSVTDYGGYIEAIRPSNDNISLAFGGYPAGAAQEWMRMVAGNVGIGSVGPTAPLDIYGAGSNSRIKIESSGGTGNGADLWFANTSRTWQVGQNVNTTADNFEIYDRSNSADRIVITQSGNVGIGTWVPAYKLDVNGQVRAGTANAILSGYGSPDIIGANSGNIYLAASNASVTFDAQGASADNRVWDAGGNSSSQFTMRALNNAGSIATNWLLVNRSTTTITNVDFPNGNVGIGTSTPQGGLVVTNGNVGIGTWAPGGALTVMGGNVGVGANPASGKLQVAGASNGSLDFLITHTTGNVAFTVSTLASGNATVNLDNSAGSVGLQLSSTAANNSYFNGSNVGIGTTTPSAPLNVSGTTGAIATSGSAGGGTLRLTEQPNSGAMMLFGTNGGNYGYAQMTNSTDQTAHYPLVINPNGGNVGIGTTVPGAALQVNGGILSSGTTGIGYTTGAGATVTQLTNKSTAVTINAPSGTITMNNATLNHGASVSFTVNDTAVASADCVYTQHDSGGSIGSYTTDANTEASGSFVITVTNQSGGNLGEAIVIKFAVIKGATS